jgi:aspartokinase
MRHARTDVDMVVQQALANAGRETDRNRFADDKAQPDRDELDAAGERMSARIRAEVARELDKELDKGEWR